MSWPIVNLGDIAEFIRGVTFKPHDLIEFGANDFVVCMRTKNIQKDLDESDLISLPKNLIKNKTKFLKKGDLLISTANSFELVGKSCWVPELEYPAVAGGFISILRAKEELLYPRYLFHWIKTSQTQNLLRNCGRQTTNISNMDFDRAKMLKIPVPPLNEQKRIASILDKADAVRRKRQQAIELSEQLLRSVFLDMFGDPVSNPKVFKLGKIGDLLSSVNYGTSSKAGENGKFPILRMNNITYAGDWDLGSLKYIDMDEKERKKYTVESGDILFNRTNSKELVGKTAVFSEKEPYIFAGYLIRSKTNSLAEPEYISSFLNSAYGKAILKNMCKSIVGMANINAKEYQSIEILIPPIEEQKKYVEITNKIREQISTYKQSLIKINQLCGALNQTAFKGEL